VLVQLLGEVFAGILCSDRSPYYLKYHKGEGQLCWAHFKRNILGALQIAKTTDAEKFCRDALALHARLFRLWHRFRAGPGVRYGPVSREQLIAKSIPLEKKFFALADRYVDSPEKDVRNLARALLKHFERFFAFLRNDGVEPTNNAAERALRYAVQWRKTSFGSRSAQGEIAVARLLTVTRTCRLQNRQPLDITSVPQYARIDTGIQSRHCSKQLQPPEVLQGEKKPIFRITSSGAAVLRSACHTADMRFLKTRKSGARCTGRSSNAGSFSIRS
jgi:transposase